MTVDVATDPVDWRLAGRVAGRVAGTHPLAESYHRELLASTAPGIIAEVAPMVTEETGLVTPEHPEVVTVGRREWAERAAGTFTALMAPQTEQLAGRMGDGAATIVALETGALLGVMARRVLGQYELVLPTGDEADTVVFVAPNVFALERSHQFRPSEFRTWLALHEATHRAQFLGVPWLREHFLSLVTGLVGARTADPNRWSRAADRLTDAIAGSRPLVDEGGLFSLFATEEQQAQVDKIQALMCLLEGHGHVVMDRIGERILTTQDRMSRLLKARRMDPRTAAFFRLTGMEMKMRQYELGEQFVNRVTEVAGWDALDAAWSGPDALPTLPEISDADSWLARVA